VVIYSIFIIYDTRRHDMDDADVDAIYKLKFHSM